MNRDQTRKPLLHNGNGNGNNGGVNKTYTYVQAKSIQAERAFIKHENILLLYIEYFIRTFIYTH